MRAAAENHRRPGNPWRSREALRAPRPRIAAALLVLLALALLPSAASAAPAERLRSFGPDGTEATDFQRIGSVAVDQQTGAVYVLDTLDGSLHKFDAEGQPLDWGGTAPYITENRIEGLAPYTGENSSQIAVDSTSHVVYVTEEHALKAFHQNGEPAEFSEGPGAGTNQIAGFAELKGLAVDVNGAIYASDQSGTVSIYSATGAELTSFATSEPTNLAVATDGTVYYVVSSFASFFERFTPDAFPVTAGTTYAEGPPVNTGGLSMVASGVNVNPANNDLYGMVTNFGSNWIKQFDASGTLLRSYGEPGTPSDAEGFGNFAQGIAAVAGGGVELQFYAGDTQVVGGTTEYSQVAIFGTNIVEGPPSVESTSIVDVTADSATFRARINPNTAATTYRFEYGTEDCALGGCASVPLGGGTIAAGFEAVEVRQPVAGLQPATTYHYRVVADNTVPGDPRFGETEGPGRTFTTQAAGLGFELADRRAWEMVSPPDKHGAELFGSTEGLIQAAADGEGLAYVSLGSIDGAPEGNRAVELSGVLARRSATGWHSRDIAPPNSTVVPFRVGQFGQYKLFTPDLSRAVLEPRTGTPLSPQASERTPYLRENTEPPLYTPLVTGKEGFANVPPGTVFGGDESGQNESFAGVKLLGATPDLSHIALNSNVSLVEGGSPGAYLWEGGQLEPLSVRPADEGSEFVELVQIGSGPGSTQHALSEDGSRVFWAPGAYSTGINSLSALYLRDTVAEQTVRLDVPQGGSGAGTARPVFQGASADGTVVFFTDSRQLTPDVSPEERNLYRCEIPAGPSPAGCATLTAISAPPPGSGESAEVLGLAPGISEDGTRVYFVAMGELDTAPNERGESAVAGEPNLYLWQQGEGVRYVATLAGEDERNWGKHPSLSSHLSAAAVTLTAAVSPSGRYLAFMSQRRLSGYDNREEQNGEPVQEIFRYDALVDRLECVSCDPTGAAPEAQVLSEVGLNVVDPRDLWEGTAQAALLPQTTVTSTSGPSFYRPRAISDSGRVFFNAFDALVPADSNGQWDVYQHEPLGVGSCAASAGNAATVRAAGGCLSLISSGTGEEEAGFLDASSDGDDVFFLTPARLSVTDEDGQLDAYDARVDGVAATLRPRAECQGEACQAPKPAPDDPTPASSSFEGQGNVKGQPPKRCPKGKRKVRRKGKVRCVARKHRKSQRHRRAGQDRRAAR